MSCKIGIIGPGRAEMGIGEYITKYLAFHGAQIKALVAGSLDSGHKSAAALNKKYGINATVYKSTQQMLKNDAIDALAICTPSATHAQLLELCEENAKHVFCEKPFLWNTGAANIEKTVNLIQGFQASGTIVHCNTQWPFTLPYFEHLHGKIDQETIYSFSMRLSPVSPYPWIMIKESAPHTNSILLALGASGEIKDCRISINPERPEKRQQVTIHFKTTGIRGQDIQVRYDFIQTPNPPRPVDYSINGKWIHRYLSSDYVFYFDDDLGNRIQAIDPLDLSIQRFLRKIKMPDQFNHHSSGSQIIKNMEMLSFFHEVYQDAAS